MARRSLAPLAFVAAVLLGCGTVPSEDVSAAAQDPEAEQPRLFSGTGSRRAKPPLRKTSLARGDVVLQGPMGYCIDPSSIGLGRSFAVLASCQVLTEGTGGQEVPLAVMTVTVGRKNAKSQVPSAQAMARAADAEMSFERTKDGMTLVYLASGGDEVLADGEPGYWRAAFVLNDRQVGLALYTPKGSVLSGRSGAALLVELHQAILAASPKKADPAAEPVAQPLQGGFLGRFLNRNQDE